MQNKQHWREKDFSSELALKPFQSSHNYAEIMEIQYMICYTEKNALLLHIWDQLVIVKYILHSFRTRFTRFYTLGSAYICLVQPSIRLFSCAITTRMCL